MSNVPRLRSGGVLYLGPQAGILYRIRPLTVRIIQVLELVHGGGAWILAYELNDQREAVEKRQLYLPDLDAITVIDETIRLPVPPVARLAVAAIAG